MKINKTSITKVPFKTLEGGAVFLFGESIFLTLQERCYDSDGEGGEEYDAVDLETGELACFLSSDFVRPLDVTLDIRA